MNRRIATKIIKRTMGYFLEGGRHRPGYTALQVEEAFHTMKVPNTLVGWHKHETLLPEEEPDVKGAMDQCREAGEKSPELQELVRLAALNLTELRDKAKAQGLTGYSKMKKDELVKALAEFVLDDGE